MDYVAYMHVQQRIAALTEEARPDSPVNSDQLIIEPSPRGRGVRRRTAAYLRRLAGRLDPEPAALSAPVVDCA
jgi:hypothetical protein